MTDQGNGIISNKDVFFSIIIPTFNAEKTLSKALQSIAEQTFDNYEILLVDGLSTDGTLEIASDFAKTNPNLQWVSEKDKGIYDAMNKGMNRSRGKWLYFLGSDDELDNKNVLADVFKNPELEKFNVVYGNVRIIGNTTWAKDGDIYDGAFSLEKLFRRNICHQGIFYQSNFVKESIGDYNTRYQLCADWDFNLRCRSKTPFLYIPQVLAKFYAGGETTNSNTDTFFSEDFVKNLLSYFNISLFDPSINDHTFPFYGQVLRMQKDRHYIKYLTKKIIKYLD